MQRKMNCHSFESLVSVDEKSQGENTGRGDKKQLADIQPTEQQESHKHEQQHKAQPVTSLLIRVKQTVSLNSLDSLSSAL